MKNLSLLIIAFLLLQLGSIAQQVSHSPNNPYKAANKSSFFSSGVDTTWVRHYATGIVSGGDKITAMIVDDESNIYLTGSSATIKYNSFGKEQCISSCNRSRLSADSTSNRLTSSKVIYTNPRVYNLDISFQLMPDLAKIDRGKDLKLWMPIPREWDSQSNVQILSVEPRPQSTYIDPEYGNKIFYWDFGKYPEKPSYQVNIKARIISYEIHTTIDSSNIKPYDKTSKEYELYTKSGHTIHITPKVKELAKTAIGNETNPYLQAQKILTFVNKKIRYEQNMNRGLDHLFSSSIIDERSGEELFIGACSHYSALFVGLCRSEGIPARCVYGRVGWVPFLNEGTSTMYSELDTVLTDDGFAGAQHHGMGPHMWAEFYLPDYGWIPVDPTAGQFGQLKNNKVIMTKGRDINLGPDAPHMHHNGYGFQWVPICDGRVEAFLSAVWNIGKIRNAISRVYHTSDPFPADALTDYQTILFSANKNSETLPKWRNRILGEIDFYSRIILNRETEFSKMYNEPVWIRSLQYRYDTFVCHMLRKVMGDKKFTQLLKEYEKLRTNSFRTVETYRFIQIAGNIYGESLEWFFSQWEKANELPRLKLDEVTLEKNNNGWKTMGKLIQSGNSFFRLPVEFSLETEKGPELYTIWQRDRITNFEFQTPNKPLILKVDANNDILKLQRMPLRLSYFWDSYPKITLIYGTISESEANKTAAERFNYEYLGLSSEMIKPDTSITDNDLNTECVILLGRPNTNKISQQFKDIFPIKFDEDKFTWKGVTHEQPTQGVAQIVAYHNVCWPERRIDTKVLRFIFV
jgi:transglutaminase-like putative cysteine protease